MDKLAEQIETRRKHIQAQRRAQVATTAIMLLLGGGVALLVISFLFRG